MRNIEIRVKGKKLTKNEEEKRKTQKKMGKKQTFGLQYEMGVNFFNICSDIHIYSFVET